MINNEDLTFVEETHEYFYKGKKLISTTQLMQKHGLAPNYSDVDPEVLKRKAEFGTFVHKQIEEWIKYGYNGGCPQLQSLIKYFEEQGIDRTTVHSEEMVNNDIVAGCVDIWFIKDNKLFIIDNKTTSVVHKEPVSWQLGVYEELGFNELKSTVKTVIHQVYHFDKEGNMEVVDISNKSSELINQLFEAERQGVGFTMPAIINDNMMVEIEKVEQLIKYHEQLVKEAKQKEEDMKSALLQAMKDNGLKTYDFGSVKATIKDSYEKSSVDTNKLKADGLYDKYKKTSTVKESLIITIKEEKE